MLKEQEVRALNEAIVVFSRNQFTSQQLEELKYYFNIYKITPLPLQLSKLWTNVNPIGPLDIKDMKPFIEFIIEKKKEGIKYAYFDGDKGMEFYMIRCALEIGIIPLYSTKYEMVVESGDGQEIKKHIAFRAYKDYERSHK